MNETPRKKSYIPCYSNTKTNGKNESWSRNPSFFIFGTDNNFIKKTLEGIQDFEGNGRVGENLWLKWSYMSYKIGVKQRSIGIKCIGKNPNTLYNNYPMAFTVWTYDG